MEYIAILIIMIIIGLLLFYILPIFAPFFLIIFIFGIIRYFILKHRREKFFKDTFTDFENQSEDTYTNTSRTRQNTDPNVIDVEYTEREDEEDDHDFS